MTDAAEPDDETSAEELLAVVRALENAGVRSWVGGGWGVDILLGRATRPHRDVDVAVDATRMDDALAALTDLGYRAETDWRPVRLELHRPGRGRVDVHPVVFDAAGDGIQAGLDGAVFHYPARALVRRPFLGFDVGCLSARLALAFREGYEHRAVDHHDVALLRGMVEDA
ncbi:MAG: hypothetical protein ABJA87_05960 [bacterium]